MFSREAHNGVVPQIHRLLRSLLGQRCCLRLVHEARAASCRIVNEEIQENNQDKAANKHTDFAERAALLVAHGAQAAATELSTRYRSR